MGDSLGTTRYAGAARIGARVRALRELQHMTTTELAKKTGFSQQQICAVELGRINTPVETLIRIADALGVTLTLLCSEDADLVVRAKQQAVSQCLQEGKQHLQAVSAKYERKLAALLAS